MSNKCSRCKRHFETVYSQNSRGQKALCLGCLVTPRAPQAGHAVRIIRSQDALIKDGSIGVLEGIADRDLAPDTQVQVCFNFSAFRGYSYGFDTESCSASGGPSFYIRAGELRPTGSVTEVLFWRWKNEIMGRDRGEEYTLTVPVWEYAAGHLFADCAVEAASVADFLDRYYKPERYRGRGPEYAATLLASHEADFARGGFDLISHHDSVTGLTVAFFGPKAT
jgi:hypothetical protein